MFRPRFGTVKSRVQIPRPLSLHQTHGSSQPCRTALPLSSDPFSKLKLAIDDARDWTAAAIKLGGLVTEKDDPAVRDLIALEYMLDTDLESDQNQRWGPFGPIMESQGYVRPVPLDQAPDEVLERWEQTVANVDHPIVQSRFNDLLWMRRRGRPDRNCRSAITAYRTLGTGTWLHEYSGYLALCRAVQLSRQLGDPAEVSESVLALLKYAEAGLRGSPPGVGLMAAEFLATLPTNARPTDKLTPMVEAIIGRDDLTIDLASDTFGLLARLSKDAKAAGEWQRRQVSTWLDGADRSQGLIRVHYLDRAVALAGNLGIADLADVARSQLQSVTDEDLELKTVSAQIDIPADDAQNYVDAFVGDDSWKHALDRFGNRPAPAGNAEKNVANVVDHMQRFPFQHLVTKRLMNSLNLPVAIVSSREEHFVAALREWENRSIMVWGMFAAPVLEGIKKRYGQPTREELTEFFTTDLIPTHIAERIGRSIEFWWGDQPDEAAHLLLPRLEAVIREMAKTAGIVIYKEPQGRNRGGVRTLGALLQELTGVLDESWRLHLSNLLTDELGYNLRNLVLHGLMPRVERIEAALLINVACYLRLLRLKESKAASA